MHDHYVAPTFDGHCVACIGARRIYCMDGGRVEDGSGDVTDPSLASCQPSPPYCTFGNRYNYYSRMFFAQCEYTPVQNPNTGEYQQERMLDLEITDEMVAEIKNGKRVPLLYLLFLPN